MKPRLASLALIFVLLLIAWFGTRLKVPGTSPALQQSDISVSRQSKGAEGHPQEDIVKNENAVAAPKVTSDQHGSAVAPLNTSPTYVSPAQSADPEALIEIDKVRLMFRDYRTVMGENPTGTNAEIMKAIMGDNPKGAKLGPMEGLTVNSNGELVDRWGTPYFFHQLSGEHMEIRSAGPDKIMWTNDDILLK